VAWCVLPATIQAELSCPPLCPPSAPSLSLELFFSRCRMSGATVACCSTESSPTVASPAHARPRPRNPHTGLSSSPPVPVQAADGISNETSPTSFSGSGSTEPAPTHVSIGEDGTFPAACDALGGFCAAPPSGSEDGSVHTTTTTTATTRQSSRPSQSRLSSASRPVVIRATAPRPTSPHPHFAQPVQTPLLLTLYNAHTPDPSPTP
jgi:hypothetical protein